MDTSGISTKDRILGSIMGGAIGDALGYQCEFEKNLKEREFTTYDNDYGIFSDDTQMMLFTANALLWHNTAAILEKDLPSQTESIRRAYLDWYHTQNDSKADPEVNVSWIDKLPEMNHRRAPGFTCLSALSDEKQGTIKEPINQSKGCGATMRVAPIGLTAQNINEAIQISAESAALTHGHPLAIIPSAFLGALYFEIMHDTKRKFSEQLHVAFEFTNQFATKNFHRQYQIDFMKIMRNAFELSRNNVHDIENIRTLGEGWTAEEAVAIAIYCCLRYSDDFDDAVIAAINHDGDSDSTGIIAGNIMGARLGIASIPPYYTDHIEQRELLLELATDLATGVPYDSNHQPANEAWDTKYLKLEPYYADQAVETAAEEDI